MERRLTSCLELNYKFLGFVLIINEATNSSS